MEVIITTEKTAHANTQVNGAHTHTGFPHYLTNVFLYFCPVV